MRGASDLRAEEQVDDALLPSSSVQSAAEGAVGWGGADDRAAIAARCRRVLAEFGSSAWRDGGLEERRVGDLQLDSLRLAELVAALEEEFGMTVGRAALRAEDTLARLVDLVCARLQGDDASPSILARPRTGGRPVETLSAMLEHAAGGQGALTWIDDDDRCTRLSFAELLESARRVATRLRRRGIRPGDRVGIVATRGDEVVPIFFGIVRSGAVAVPLAPPAAMMALPGYVARLEARLASVEPALLVLDGGVAALLGALVTGVPVESAKDLLTPNADAEPRGAPVPTAGGLGQGSAVDGDGARDAPDALALLQFSSGTGGLPKPVALRHRHLLANVSAAAERAGMNEEDHFVSWLPLFHDMGLIGGVLTPIRCGASVTLMSPQRFLRRPVTWLRAISEARATVSLAPNFGYAYAARRVAEGACGGLDLSSWRLAWNGAETVRLAVIEAFIRRFARVGFRASAMVPTYGLAEASLCVTCPLPAAPLAIVRVDRALLRRGRAVPSATERDAVVVVGVGRALPGFAVRIDGPSRSRGSDGVVGEILVRGPSLMEGYFNTPDTPAVLADGWLRTGDVGFLRDGELFVCGRLKDVVVVRGVNYHTVELEAAVEEVAGTRAGRSVVFSEPGAYGESDLVVVAEVRRDAQADAVRGGIVRNLRERLGLIPARVVLVPARTLPVTTSGKLCREACRQRHGRAGGPLREQRVRWERLTWRAARHLAVSVMARVLGTWRPPDLPVDV